MDLPLTLRSDPFAPVATFSFVINAAVSGTSSSVEGALILVGEPMLPEAHPESRGVVLGLDPRQAIAGQGTAANFRARVTNTGSVVDSFALSVTGLPAGFTVTFAQSSFEVPPGASNFREVPLIIVPPPGTTAADYTFQVIATSTTEPHVRDAADGLLTVLQIGVDVDITPVSGDPGSTFQLRVTNTGRVTETFDLSLAAPAALVATLGQHSVMLDPGQSQLIPIAVGAIDFAVPGSLLLVGVATLRTEPAVADADSADVTITGRFDMTASFDKGTIELPVPGAASFVLLIESLGNLEDQYTATILDTSGPITASLHGLDGQPTQTIPLFILPGLSTGAILLSTQLAAFGEGTITVQVTSLSDPSITSQATARLMAQEPRADLSLTKTVDLSHPAVGQEVTFTVTLTNSGPDSATGISVTDALPAGLDFVRAEQTRGHYDSATGLWEVSELENGTTVVLRVTARVLAASSITNSAEITTADQMDPDSIPGNHAAHEDDYAAAVIGQCLSGGPLQIGQNRLVYSCATPGSITAFVMGTQAGSYHFKQYGATVDMADPSVPALGIADSHGVAVVLFKINEKQLSAPLMFQAFEMRPRHNVSNLLTLQAPRSPLRAGSIGLGAESLSASALPALVEAAKARWQLLGLTPSERELLQHVEVVISDLPGDYLGSTVEGTVLLDRNAAGHGWFVDATPEDDIEYTLDVRTRRGRGIGAAAERVDALTVVMHELGHILGLPDVANSNHLMHGQLDAGVRRTSLSDTNLRLPSDVDANGYVSPIDALLVINALNRGLATTADPTSSAQADDKSTQYLDTNADFFLSPIDALLVINYLNQRVPGGPAGEGEAVTGAGDTDATLQGTAEEVYDNLLSVMIQDTPQLPPVARQLKPSDGGSTSAPTVEAAYGPSPYTTGRATQVFFASRTSDRDFPELEPVLDLLVGTSEANW